MQIGAVAQKTGLSVDAIRFYEKQGLLPAPDRTDGGYRIYVRTDLERLDFVVQAQELGFSLSDVRELLMLSNEAAEACPHVRELISEKRAAVQQKIEDLEGLERRLRDAEEKCDRESAEHCFGSCPVLEELAHGTNKESDES